MEKIIEALFAVSFAPALWAIAGLVFYVQDLEENVNYIKSKGILRKGIMLQQRLKIMLSYVAILVCAIIAACSLADILPNIFS